MRRLLVAEPALVPRLAHLLLVAEPLQVLGRDAHPWRFRRGAWWMRAFGGHEAIVTLLEGKFRPGLPISLASTNCGTKNAASAVNPREQAARNPAANTEKDPSDDDNV
jgi:hypothetical protein